MGKITYNQLLTYSGHLDKLSEEITGDFAIDTKVCRDIFVLKIFPGIGTELFDFIRTQYKGVIIESFGIGGIPNVDEDIVSKIHELIGAGVVVVITTWTAEGYCCCRYDDRSCCDEADVGACTL